MQVVLPFFEFFAFAQETMMFQVFQLTALAIPGPATHGENLIVSLDCVVIKEEEVRSVLLCVRDFLRSREISSQRPA